MHVFAGSSAATSAARCSSRGESSSEPPTRSSAIRETSGACRGSVALAGNDIGLVKEPEASMFLQDLAGGIQIAGVAQRLRQAHVVHLRDVDGGVPRREQRGGADARRDLRGQRMHVVAENRSRVGVGVEVVVARLLAEL